MDGLPSSSVMESLSWLEVTEAVATVVMTVTLVASAAIARYSYRNAVKRREDQTRPRVTLDFDMPHSPRQVELFIRNAGPTIARNVSFRFTPELRSSYDQEEGPSIRATPIIDNGIPTLPPNREYGVLFERADRLGEHPRYKVEVEYEGPTGRKYRDTQRLDLSTMDGTKYLAPHTFDVTEALRGIRSALESINKKLGGSGEASDGSL